MKSEFLTLELNMAAASQKQHRMVQIQFLDLLKATYEGRLHHSGATKVVTQEASSSFNLNVESMLTIIWKLKK